MLSGLRTSTSRSRSRLISARPPSALISKALGPIEGIVGFSFFARYRMTVDYQAKVMTFVPTNHVLTSALGRLQRSGEVIWTFVTAADLAQAGASIEEAEGIVDVIRVAREHEVAVVLKEDTTDAGGRWKVSVRSRGTADVGAACTALGGGGHRLAAGFGADGEPAAIIAQLQGILAAGE